MAQQDFAKPSTTRKSAPKKGGGKGSQSKKKAAPAQPAPPAPSKGRGKLILLLIVLIGGFAYALYLLQGVPAAPSASSPEETPSNTKRVVTPPASNTDAQSPPQRFKFYDLLPESEVQAPEVDAYQFRERSAEEPYNYIIQTGSFRNLADAERQKATIAFQGLKASINTVKNAQGTTWHRVSTGPFQTRSDMNNALDKLVSINIEPLVKKIKP